MIECETLLGRGQGRGPHAPQQGSGCMYITRDTAVLVAERVKWPCSFKIEEATMPYWLSGGRDDYCDLHGRGDECDGFMTLTRSTRRKWPGTVAVAGILTNTLLVRPIVVVMSVDINLHQRPDDPTPSTMEVPAKGCRRVCDCRYRRQFMAASSMASSTSNGLWLAALSP